MDVQACYMSYDDDTVKIILPPRDLSRTISEYNICSETTELPGIFKKMLDEVIISLMAKKGDINISVQKTRLETARVIN